MRIFQLAPTLAHGDAIGNDVLALDALIKRLGYTAGIFYEHLHNGVLEKMCVHYKNMPKVKSDDIVIYHLATASPTAYFFSSLECRKIVIYHNITPPEFFLGYSGIYYRACKDALVEAEYLADKADYCLADSGFNKSDLEKMGYACPIDVLPILIPFEDYAKPPDAKIIKFFIDDDKKNMLFTGRIAPNKKIENIIKTFCQYQRHVNKNSRLFLVGSYSDEDIYYRQLKTYVKDLQLTDVVFTGHIPFSEVIAYYKLSDVYLCMSEHEGFCVPLLEAMYFDKPIVAYDSLCAVKETLGGCGVLLENDDPLVAAMIIGKILEDKELSDAIIAGQRERLKDFRYENVSRMFETYIKGFVGRTYAENSAD
ncbi:MAG: glycosyltransferase family 4 protein [Treponema sp.]|jgi:glycosyltransferase involved in cell wall biosynthesis|nr:glycosyltransferase family 4 protein [Treponema sp.]